MSSERDPKISDGMEAIEIPECERLLQTGGIGILALAGVSVPLQRPVNFAVHKGRLLIRTGNGQIFAAAQSAEPASFAVCEIDPFEHKGWSVVVTGKLVELSPASSQLDDLKLRPWARAEKSRVVTLSIEEISGRRLAEVSSAG